LAVPENLALLADTLSLGDLKIEATEVSVGDFRLDILAFTADDDDNRVVLIENQFGKTDHSHLGQLLTYASGQKGPLTAIWLAEQFREEHRAAVDWLNSNTSASMNFFAVEVQALKIDDSRPAPWFKVVAKPNNWARSISRLTSEGLTGRQTLYLGYWEAFRAVCKAAGWEHQPALPRGRFSFPAGRSGFRVRGFIDPQEKKLRAELWIRPKGAVSSAYSGLIASRDIIEKELGFKLDWQNYETRALAFSTLGYFDLEDRTDWPRQHQWLFNNLKSLKRAFQGPIRNLKLAENTEIVDATDSDDES
jgi:hypothetical protein